MRKMTYTGPVDTLEIVDPQDPQKVIFSEHLHPGRSYKLPDEGGHQVIDTMVGRGLFIDPKAEAAEIEPSPVDATSPGAPAPATVPETPATPAAKPRRN